MTTATKPRILLVDDEPQLLAGLQIHLRRLYEVHLAQTGADAIELLRELPGFAVIISDMRMPGMTGVEVLRRAASMAPETTRMLLTGYADIESAIGAVNEGKVFRFLTKPCAPPTLLAAVADAVAAHRELLGERAFVRGEHHRVSEKVLKAGRRATMGALATGAGQALQTIASHHSEALDTVIARATAGDFVCADDLRELRDLEAHMFRTARCLAELSSESDDECEEVDLRRVAERAVEHIRVLDAAVAQGHEVSALTRRPMPSRAGVDWVSGSLGQRDALDRLVAGADAVIHVAGVISGRSAADFDRANVDGTQAMLDAARNAGVKRFVHVSSIAAREPELSLYGASKAKSEQLVANSGLPYAIVRPPAVYGPGDAEMLYTVLFENDPKLATAIATKPIRNITDPAIHWVNSTSWKSSCSNQSTSVYRLAKMKKRITSTARMRVMNIFAR